MDMLMDREVWRPVCWISYKVESILHFHFSRHSYLCDFCFQFIHLYFRVIPVNCSAFPLFVKSYFWILCVFSLLNLWLKYQYILASYHHFCNFFSTVNGFDFSSRLYEMRPYYCLLTWLVKLRWFFLSLSTVSSTSFVVISFEPMTQKWLAFNSDRWTFYDCRRFKRL